jgi:recombination associated protein RdgC
MFFKNLTIFRFPIPTGHSDYRCRLDDGTGQHPLKPVGPLELSSRGWVSPTGQEPADGDFLPFYSSADNNLILLTLGGGDRMLPSAVINAELAKRLAKIEADEGRKLGGRARKALKEDLVHELLPRAFVKPSRLNGYLDLGRGLVVVDTASRKQAEGFVSELRHALGSFPALPLNAQVAPRAVLTWWIAPDAKLPGGLMLGDEATLKDAADKGAAVRVTRQELTSDEIGKHLEAGKQVTRLGLYLDDSLSFTLDEDLTIRKLKFGDVVMDKLEGEDIEDLSAELEARFFLMASEIGTLFDVLAGEHALSFTKVET